MTASTRVLVTGAAGRVGGLLIRSLKRQYSIVATDRRQPAADLGVPFVRAELLDEAAIRRLCEGIDVVLHLAADPNPHGEWDSLLSNNILGSHIVFHAAAAAGCRRVVFASSLWVANGYPAGGAPIPSDVVHPPNLYGVSKAASEALARMLADTSRTSFVCLRIGWMRDLSEWRPRVDSSGLPSIITDRDLSLLFRAAIDAPAGVRFGVFNGVSDNASKSADIESARAVLGYRPVDNSFAIARGALDNAYAASWPTVDQELLLEAALSEGSAAIDAWRGWEERVDWDRDLEEGSYRLLPLAYDNLQRAGFDEPIMQKLKGIYRLAWYRNQTSQTRLTAILRALHAAKVRTLVLKGAALITSYYRRAGLRPMSDVDILVRAKDVAAAVASLESLGWHRHENAIGVDLEQLIAARHALMLEDVADHQIDLHWHVLQDNCQPGADDSFWSDAIEITIGGEPTLALSPTDQLFHVCVHGARWNELPSIRWIADAMTILQTSSGRIDWDRLLRQAHDRLLVLPTRATLSYLSDVFDAPIPKEFLRRLRSDAVSRRERAEFAYRSSDHRQRLLGYLPIIWFDYLRSRAPLSSESEVWGFARYLGQRVGAPSVWLMPWYLFITSPRVRRLIPRRDP